MAEMVQVPKKMKWIRVSIDGLYVTDYKSLMMYVKRMTSFLKCRFFFMFEQTPQFMLQLDCRNIAKVKKYCEKNKFKKISVKFIESPEEANAYAVKFYCLGAEFALYKCLSGKYREKYLFPNFVKLIHCLCNQQFASDRLERAFYYMCLSTRQ